MPKKSQYATEDERAAARREYLRAYLRRWRAEHKDKVLAQRVSQAKRLIARYSEEAGSDGN